MEIDVAQGSTVMSHFFIQVLITLFPIFQSKITMEHFWKSIKNIVMRIMWATKMGH